MPVFITQQFRALRILIIGLWALRQPTLRQISADIDREHFKNNATIAAYRYGWFRSMVEWAGIHPWRTVAAITILYVGIMVETLFMQRCYLDRCLHKLPDNFQDINIGLLAAQATLIAVVYPLVIALVGILFDIRTTIGGRLNVFFKETEAIPTGLSALLLCATITIQLPIASQLPLRMVAAMSILNCFWFGFNVFALGFFLVTTFKYTRPQTRMSLLYRYTANVAWHAERRRIITTNRQLGAVAYGYIPGNLSVTGDSNAASGNNRQDFKVSMISLGNYGDSAATIVLPREKQLADIRLSLLAVVARSWLKVADAADTSPPPRRRDARLTFAPMYGNLYKQEVVLASSSTQYPLDWAQKFLIRLAYRFRSPLRQLPPSTTELLLKEQITELIPLVETGRIQEFESQVTQLKEFHIFLFKIAEAYDEDDGKFNYAQMESSLKDFGRTLGDLWAGQYRDLFKRVVNRLSNEPEFFSYCAYLSASLYAGASDAAKPNALKNIGNIAFHLFWRLGEWGAATHKAETGTSGHPGIAFELQAKTAAIYARAWRDFVAGWERLANSFYGFGSRQDERGWDELVYGFEPLQTHLFDTVKMVGLSAWAGDLLAVYWSTDILLRWYDTSERSWGGFGGRNWIIHTGLVTTSLLQKPWPEIDTRPLALFEGSTIAPREVFSAAIENAWRDARFILVFVLIRWAAAHGSQGAAAIAAKRILRHTLYDRAAATHAKPFTADDLLASILRLFASGGRLEAGYTSTIGSLVGRLNDLTQQHWVSARIYSSWGFNDIYELSREQAIALITLMPDDAVADIRLSLGLTDLLRQAAGRDDEVARNLQRQLGELKTAVDALNQATDGALISALREANSMEGFERWRITARALLDACLAVLATHREERIRQANIDPARLDSIAAAASSTGFTKNKADFPIALFQEVKRTPERLTEWTLRFTNQERGQLTSPLMADPVSNEASWWSETMRSYAAMLVLSDIGQSSQTEEVRADTPEAWWEAIKAAAAPIEQANDKPILIVASLVEPEWLSEWTWNIPIEGQSRRPADLRVWRSDADKKPGYELHLNEIAVYRANCDPTCSYLIPASLLRRVEFTEYAPDRPILIEFEDDPNDAWHGTLKATFARRVTLGDGKIIRIKFDDHPEETVHEEV